MSSNFDLKSFLPYQLSILSRRVSGLIAREYGQRFGLRLNEWRVMVVAAQDEPRSSSEICQITLMDKMSVSRAVKGLVDKGFVLRIPSDYDKRLHNIVLTQRGREIYAEVMPLARAYETKLLDRLSETEHSALDAILTKLGEAALNLER
ncbi:MarR family winged helix-turn-helix transcriptional regulator [Robiginitomaculum antarcticum]|uniref:MarR family winged helix-turn-helix transcriptional regulator n=1 Tax=Robiginitomaculum antarcticum TaxID=437507 RepID=UPI00036CBCDC|nr:MarR family winged helix-turn-helix transcriptional regulator [Robiginitomaculum antarcticum]